MPALDTDGVIGHGSVLKLLSRWVQSPSFAYLFYGPAHVGKALVAERFVSALTGYPADRDFRLHPDIVVFDVPEGKREIPVKLVRETYLSRLQERPQIAPRMVGFLPRMEWVNDEGCNALLKTMEEPPAGAVFVAVAEDLSAIPATVLSRMTVVPFGLVPAADIVAGIGARGVADADVRARVCRGRPGLALADGGIQTSFRTVANAYADGPGTGNRCAAVARLVSLCDGAEDPGSAWRDALQACADALRPHLLRNPCCTLALGQGVADAFGCIGTGVHPRLALEAAAIQAGRGTVPSITIYPSPFIPSFSL